MGPSSTTPTIWRSAPATLIHRPSGSCPVATNRRTNASFTSTTFVDCGPSPGVNDLPANDAGAGGLEVVRADLVEPERQGRLPGISNGTIAPPPEPLKSALRA